MRKATKVLYFFAGLLVIVYTAGAYLAIFGDAEIQSYAQPVLSDLYGFYAVSVAAGLVGLIGLIILLRGIFAKRRDRKVTVATEENGSGKVEVSEEAVQAAVMRTIDREVPSAKEKKIKAKLHNGKQPTVDIEAQIGKERGATLAISGERIQTAIRDDVQRLLGLSPEKVDVTFYEVNEG